MTSGPSSGPRGGTPPGRAGTHREAPGGDTLRARRSGRLALLGCAALLLVAPTSAGAKELARDDSGAVLEASAFYKSFLSGTVLQPDAVRAARAYARLLEETRSLAPPGVQWPRTAPLPSGGALTAHLVRVSARFRYLDRVELDVASQLALTVGTNPAFVNSGALSGTVSGTGAGAGAQRRLVELAGAVAGGASWRVDHDLDRLSLKFPLPFGDLTIGRQVLSWGTGRMWNPTDVLSPFPPTAVDREIRRGFDAVRLAVALGDLTQLDLLYLPQLRAEDNGGVVRLQTNVEGWDGSVSVGKYVRDLMLGADLVGDLGPVGVHAEAAYTLELRGLGTSQLAIGEHFFRGVAGATVRPHEKLVLLAEYAFNSYGTTDPARYAAVLSSPRVVRGELFGAGKHQAAIAASYLADDLLSLQLSTLVNLTDPSALLIPSLEYAFTQTVLIRAGAYVPLGRAPDPAVYSSLTPTDVLTASEAHRAALRTRGLRSEYGAGGFGAFLQLGLYVP